MNSRSTDSSVAAVIRHCWYSPALSSTRRAAVSVQLRQYIVQKQHGLLPPLVAEEARLGQLQGKHQGAALPPGGAAASVKAVQEHQ